MGACSRVNRCEAIFMSHISAQNLLEQLLVRRNTASVEIPKRLSTTGESPVYDLRFRWTQSARHIAMFDLTSVAGNSDAPGPHNCRALRRAEDPVEPTEYSDPQLPPRQLPNLVTPVLRLACSRSRLRAETDDSQYRETVNLYGQ